MREDLGTWPPAQAEALIAILADDGIEAAAEPGSGRGGDVRVSVEAADADRATRTMSARMDEIAAAAEQPPAHRAPRWYEEEDDDASGRPLVMERFRQAAKYLAVLVAGLMVAVYVPGPFKIVSAFIAFAVLAAMVLRGRREDRDDDHPTYGPGA